MQWLDRLGIPYEAKDIEADEAAHDELMKKDGFYAKLYNSQFEL
jgi:hypothetical protein